MRVGVWRELVLLPLPCSQGGRGKWEGKEGALVLGAAGQVAVHHSRPPKGPTAVPLQLTRMGQQIYSPQPPKLLFYHRASRPPGARGKWNGDLG